ncbi:MAG: DUF3696 domain-containing protein [Calditrichaeota bacterium]|nr:DUF3696 domain-containing protein [Calditrichota bacterium]
MIKQIDLNNFKCFENQKLEVSSLTLLSGLNGLGKSTILQSLLLLRQSFQQNLIPEKGLSLNGDIIKFGTAFDILFEGATEDIIGIKVYFDNNNMGEWIVSYFKEKDILPFKKKPRMKRIYDENVFTDDFQYLEAERLGPRMINEMSEYAVNEHKQLGKQGQYALHFLSVFGDKDIPNKELLHPKGFSKGLHHQVEGWLNEVSPGTRLNLLPIGPDMIQARYSFVKGKQVSNSYSAVNVGFGLSYTLPVIVAVLSAKPGSLLLIENPEAHLHPQGQAKIGEMLAIAAEAGVQLIVETHSDHVLNGIRVAVHQGKIKPENVKIHFFQPDKSDDLNRTSVITPNIDRDGRLDPWPDGFFDQWDKSLRLLLFPSSS